MIQQRKNKTRKLHARNIVCECNVLVKIISDKCRTFSSKQQAGHKEKKMEERMKEKSNKQAFYSAEKQSNLCRQSRKPSDLVCVLPMELYELGWCCARTGKTKPSPKLEQK